MRVHQVLTIFIIYNQTFLKKWTLKVQTIGKFDKMFNCAIFGKLQCFLSDINLIFIFVRNNHEIWFFFYMLINGLWCIAEIYITIFVLSAFLMYFFVVSSYNGQLKKIYFRFFSTDSCFLLMLLQIGSTIFLTLYFPVTDTKIEIYFQIIIITLKHHNFFSKKIFLTVMFNMF